MPGNAPVFNADNIPLNTVSLKGIAQRNALASALIGAAPGGTALSTRTRVAATPDNSGKVTTEVFNALNRVTTAADVANLKAEVLKRDRVLQFPADLSGNGGKAFLRGNG